MAARANRKFISARYGEICTTSGGILLQHSPLGASIHSPDDHHFIVLLGGYFTMRGRFGSADFFSAAGVIANVSQTFQPSGWCAASQATDIASPPIRFGHSLPR